MLRITDSIAVQRHCRPRIASEFTSHKRLHLFFPLCFTLMRMAKKCDAKPCFTTSARSSKIACWKCDKSYHLRCADVSGNQQKTLRGCAGAVWLCPVCLNSPTACEQKSPALNMILDRLSSITRLINVQIDATRSLCRAYGQNLPRFSCLHRSPRNTAPNDARDFDEEINNIQLEFSNIFNSFCATDHRTDVHTNKRNRTSSCSSSRLTSRIEKRIRIDASVDTSDLLPGTTVTGTGPTAGSDELPQHSNSVPVNISPGNATSIRPVEARHDSAPLTRESNTQTITTSTNSTSVIPEQSTEGHRPDGAITSLISSQSRNRNLQRMQPRTLSEMSTPPTSYSSVTGATIVAGVNLRPNNHNLQHNNSLAPCIPTLSIAPPMKQAKWFYITRFLPIETCENIIRFISGKCNCEPSLIRCHKLLRRNSKDMRPLSFLSFKINVPEFLEDSITSSHFWPKGVSISPFLDRTPVRVQGNLATPHQQLRVNAQQGYQQYPNRAQQDHTTDPQSMRAQVLPQRFLSPPTQQL